MTRPGASLAIAIVTLTAIALAGGGCQAIVGDAIPTFTCAGTAQSACPVGQFCKGSGCVPCEPRDVCDGYDNDCNGKVDDGDLSDRDADGFTFCGYVDAVSGSKLVFDCDDNDKDVHPGAQELCNGKDDDCDGVIDNPGLACPENRTCAPKLAACVDPSSLCSPQNCPAPKVCDADTQQCVTPNAAKIGEACTANRACETEICGDAATLSPAVASNGNFCTKPCCTSAECPRESLCYATGAGGNYCVPKSAIKLATSLGTTEPGEPCTSDTDCRSGSCEPASKRCIDTCCSDANCKGGTLCRFATTFRGKPGFACQAPNGGSSEQNTACRSNADCKSGLCHDYGIRTQGIYLYCAIPCCGSSRCGSVDFGVFGGGRSDLACTNGLVGAQGDVAATCSREKQGRGRGALGAPCSDDGSCASELCLTVDGGKQCTDVCCTDADCASVGWFCRPVPVQNKLYLRCVPP